MITIEEGGKSYFYPPDLPPIKRLNITPVNYYGILCDVYEIRHDSDICEPPAFSPRLPKSCNGVTIRFYPRDPGQFQEDDERFKPCKCTECRRPVIVNETAFGFAIEY